MFELSAEIDTAVEEIQKRKPSLVAIQAPEGLKPQFEAISTEIEKKTGVKTFMFINPIFGACMLADDAAKKMGADLLLHFGHSQFFKNESIPTVYLPVRYTLPTDIVQKTFDAIGKEFEKENIKKAGLTATIQFLPYLDEIKSFLKKKGIESMIPGGRIISAGQVLGCNYSAPLSADENVDAILFFGDGMFHPLGIAFTSNKRVFIANPFEQSMKEITDEKKVFLKKRRGMISAGLQAKKFGFLVSTEKGQFGFRRALQLKQQLEEKGKEALGSYMFSM